MSINKKRRKSSSSAKYECETCTFLMRSEYKCPTKGLDCFEGRKTGHFIGSKSCQKNKKTKLLDKQSKRGPSRVKK